MIAKHHSQLATNPQVSYLTADHLGSPRVITDGGGAVISRHDYMAFGSDITEAIGTVGGRTTTNGYTSADEVRKQYTGYERDDESNLDYAQARYYNSNHGRFFWENGDAYGLNRTGTTGSFWTVRGANLPMTLIRVQLIHYFVNSENHLVRRVFGVIGSGFIDSVIAEHVTDLQLIPIQNRNGV